MKAKFTLLVMLFFLTTSIYALENEKNRNAKTAVNHLKSRTEMSGIRRVQNPLKLKSHSQNRANSLKSALAIKQRLDYIENQIWDIATGLWEEEGKAEYTYDIIGKVTQIIYYYHDSITNQFVAESKIEFTYDANGNVTQEIDYYMDETSQQWITEGRSEGSYDSYGNITQSNNFIWDENSNQWVIEYYDETEYTYNANGKVTQEIYYFRDEMFKKEITYDANGTQTQFIYYAWDKTLNKWYDGGVYPSGYTYDGDGRIIRIDEYVNSGTQDNPIITVSPWKYEITYAVNGDLIQRLNSDWLETTNDWVPRNKYEYSYNTSFPFSELIVVPGDWIWEHGKTLNYFNHQLTSEVYHHWDVNTNKWILTSRTNFNYSEQNVTSVNPLDAKLSRIYPNPCSEIISFSIPDSYSQIAFELFDLQGRKILSKEISNNEKVSMEGFRSGMYLYKMNVDGKVEGGKLVKE